MKNLIIIIIVSLVTLLNAQEKIKNVYVTIYNSDLGVVREIREFDLPKDVSEVKVTGVAERIDPTSVHINFEGNVIEQNYQYDLISLFKILQKYIDNDIDLISDKELISGKLLSVSSNSIVIQKKDGGLLLLPDLNKYHISVKSLPKGLITKPTLIWTLNSNKQGKQDVELSYQTSGMNWHAEYVAVLDKDDKQMDLNSWVSIENNSGATYENAILKLVAGDINRIQPMPKSVEYDMMERAAAPMISEKEFFEYHIYNLQKPTTINNNEIKQISLFEASKINIQKKYIYKSSIYGNSQDISVYIDFINSKNNQLGIPLPSGKIRLNKSDGSSIEFIGEDIINHTPKDEKITLKAGNSFDLKAEESTKEQKRISSNVMENTYEIKLRNHKNEDVIIQVEKFLGTNWEVISSNFKYDKKDGSTITFQIPVKKDKEEIINLKVRYINQ
ncbi:DUF4139 domain-containing protein [Bacteroidetes/Chlorobi group bacterium ChocPot_Mid]|jgi:hypothetical protein|nr:MAG: DUF4139 domain-containing protein [Bacteroidetes/Chlorobi group bacterium ChocPot_Mid]